MRRRSPLPSPADGVRCVDPSPSFSLLLHSAPFPLLHLHFLILHLLLFLLATIITLSSHFTLQLRRCSQPPCSSAALLSSPIPPTLSLSLCSTHTHSHTFFTHTHSSVSLSLSRSLPPALFSLCHTQSCADWRSGERTNEPAMLLELCC